VTHFKDQDRPEKIILLKESTEEGYLQQISPYVHVKTDRERGSIFKKIELFWPHSLLEVVSLILQSLHLNFVTILDSSLVIIWVKELASWFSRFCGHRHWFWFSLTLKETSSPIKVFLQYTFIYIC